MNENINRGYVKDAVTAIRILPDFDGIPDELKERRQWIVWSAEPSPDGGKPRKVPRHARGYRIATTKPEHFMTFEEVRAAYLRGSAPRPTKERAENPESSEDVTFAGIGFVFDGEVGEDGLTYVGVDIDDCLIDGELSDLAVSILDATTTYVEVSPRGTGIHLIARAKPLSRGLNSHNLGLETYSNGRYFTITGQQPFGCETRATVTEEVETFDNVAQMIADDLKVAKDFQHSSPSSAWDWSVANLPTRERKVTGNDKLYVDSPKAELAKARAAAMAIVGKRLAPGEAVPFTGHDPRTFLGFAFANFAADHPELADEAWEAYFAVSQAAGNDAARDEQWWDETMRSMANGGRRQGQRRTIASIFALCNEEERKGNINSEQVKLKDGYFSKGPKASDARQSQEQAASQPENRALRRRRVSLTRKHKRARWKSGYDLLSGEVSLFAGDGGGGKSTSVMNKLLGVASGRDIFGEKVWGAPKRILIVNGEDNEEEIEKRIHAAALRYELTQEEVDNIEFIGVDSPDPFTLVINNERGKAALDLQGLAILEQHIQELRPEIVILDPLQSFCPADVIDGGAIGQLIKALKRIAAAYDLAVGIIHHPRKSGPGGRETLTIDDIKGSSAITQHARVVKLLRKMDEKEADQYHILPSDRWRYFRWETVKHNLRPLKDELVWFKLESFSGLPFEPDEFDETEGPESKQVLVRADFSDIDTSYLTPMQEQMLQREIVCAANKADEDNASFSPNPQGAGNARYIVKCVRHLLNGVTGIERPKEDEEAILRAFIDKMFEADFLAKVSKKVGTGRKARQAIVVGVKGRKLLPVHKDVETVINEKLDELQHDLVNGKKTRKASKASKEGVKGGN